ncbi:MarR family winged helix-turn-helix transcriptional regulator [Plantibacter sp. RU18]|uniref:MarR family winged helix-turn-helix transcriptional regulator n=2 Tax=unclassified Plantibacter TaxID=2624265 RepID=UPI003D36CF71
MMSTHAARSAADAEVTLGAAGGTSTPSEHDVAIGAVEEQFGLLINRIRNGIRERAERIAPGLQPAGYKLLSMVTRCGSIRAGALAEMLATDKSAVSRLIHQLEEMGLLARTPDPEDGRASLIVATPEGVARMESTRASDQAMLYQQLSSWDEHEVRRLAELLAKLNDTL